METKGVSHILACAVRWLISLVNAPIPFMETAAREKVYSVLARRPSTTYDVLGSKFLFSCLFERSKMLSLTFVHLVDIFTQRVKKVYSLFENITIIATFQKSVQIPLNS